MTALLFRLAALGALLAALWAGVLYLEGRGYRRAQAEAAVQIHATQAQAAQKLAAQTERVRLAERALTHRVQQQEVQDARNAKTIATLADRLRAYTGPGLRLRDPHATTCTTGRGPGGGGAPGDTATAPGAGAGDGAEAGGVLSVPLAELLGRIVREADEVNAAYVSCRADAWAVRGAELSDER